MSNPFEFSTTPDDFASGAREVKLKRIGVWSAGIFGGAAGVIGGLVGGGIFFLLSMAGAQLGNQGPQALGMGAGALVFLPLLYGFFGFIGGLLNAYVYNIVAGLSGGIEMEFGPK